MPDLTGYTLNLNSAYGEELRRLLYSSPLYSFDMPGTTKTGGTPKMSSTISTTPASALADLVSSLGKEGADLSGVKNAFDCIEAEKRQKIEKALDGAVATAAIEKPKTRRFRLVYFSNDRITTFDGIAYKGAEGSKADEDDIDKVHVQTDLSYPVRSDYTSMKALRKRLDDQKILYRISFID